MTEGDFVFKDNALLPKLPSRPGISLVTVNIVKIGLKDANTYIDPFFLVSCKGALYANTLTCALIEKKLFS